MMKSLLKKISFATILCLGTGIFCSLTYVITKTCDPEQQLQSWLIPEEGSVKKALFSPDDDVRTMLVTLIANEKEKIAVAIYTLTEKQIAQALVDAAGRGVHVECIVDNGFGGDRWSKVPLLANNGLTIWVYQTNPNDKYGSLMHNKFFIFGRNVSGKSLLWTGSYNATKAASTRNQENVVILDDSSLIACYERHFDILKGRSIQISGKPGQGACAECRQHAFFPSLIRRLKEWVSDFFSL